MVMEKILESEFRNNLYKSLVDAGYEKKEAQKIVGVKYHGALKADLKAKLNVLVARVEGEDYDNLTFNGEEINGLVEELKKIKGVIS
jgi:hypothetical protein